MPDLMPLKGMNTGKISFAISFVDIPVYNGVKIILSGTIIRIIIIPPAIPAAIVRKLNFDFSVATFSDALSELKTHVGKVLIMSEDETLCCPNELFYNNEKVKNFVAKVDVKELAKLIEDEWYGSYKLATQNTYNPDAILPEDLYVFDESMTWLVVFTHETTDWEFDENNPMKQAETRYCIIHK